MPVRSALAVAVLSVLLSAPAVAQRVTLSGYVEDAVTRERLIGAPVYDAARGVGTVTNRYGFYSLTLPTGLTAIAARYAGYRADTLALVLRRDTTVTVRLVPGDVAVAEVVVEGRRAPIEETTRMSTIEVPVAQMRRLPAIFGEVDVLKTLQLLPGVQEGVEGSSGIYVRGGGPDQNLILLDGVPVYNAFHLFGFFSVFPADAIHQVELTKGGFPARYGGRLSSVVDIALKEGSRERVGASGSVGLIASHLTVEGPLGRRTAFVASGRRTYLDLLVKPFLPDTTQAGYRFYDGTVKVNHDINARHRVYASLYTGDDRFHVDASEGRTEPGFGRPSVRTTETTTGGLAWGNVTGALRWNWAVTPRLFVNTTLTTSRYRFQVRAGARTDEAVGTAPSSTVNRFFVRYTSGIDDLGARIDADYRPSPAHYVRAGLHATRHVFTPGAFVINASGGERIDTSLAAARTQAPEIDLYAEDDVRVGPRLKVNVGLRGSLFRVEGRSYVSAQPRVSARWLAGGTAIKASFATMQQHLHLLSSAGVGLPIDLWVPATRRVPPQRAWQVAVGVARTVRGVELSAEAYTKRMRGLVNYREGALFAFPGGDWQRLVVSGGDGWARGVEVFAQKSAGRTTGWIGYTLASTDRRFDDINGGARFPYRYDRRHDVSAVVTHDLSRAFDVSATWVYGTGVAATLARQQFAAAPPAPPTTSSGDALTYYGAVNSFRMPAYHRLDLSVQWTRTRGRRERVWSLSVYNAYNRKNPFYATVGREETSAPDGTRTLGRTVLRGYALFPAIPSLAYRFSF